MSLLKNIPRLVQAGIENPDEIRYLDSHHQIGLVLKDSVQVYTYSFSSNRYMLLYTLSLEGCRLYPFSKGFILRCGDSRTLESYKFTKGGEFERKSFGGFPRGTAIVITTQNRDFLFVKAEERPWLSKLIDLETGRGIGLIWPDKEETITLFQRIDIPKYIGLNFFLGSQVLGDLSAIWELVGNEFISKEELPESFSSGKLVDERINLYAFETTSEENPEIVLATILPYSEVLRIRGFSVKVIGPAAVVVTTGEEGGGETDSLYALKDGVWENTQTFSNTMVDYPGNGLAIVWKDEFTREALLKWNPSTDILETIRKGNVGVLGFIQKPMLSSRLALYEEQTQGEEEVAAVPIISDLLSGADQRFDFQVIPESSSVLTQNPVEPMTLSDIIQSLLPCGRSACVVPKEVTGVIAKFL